MIDVDVEPNTKSGKNIKIKGKGIKSSLTSNVAGDLTVEVNIVPFENITAEQQKILEDFREKLKTDNFAFSKKYEKKFNDLFN